MSDPNDNMGVGGGQMPLGPVASMEADSKAMKSGRGRMLAAMIGSVVLAVIALIAYMASGGETEMYSQFGRNINGLRTNNFDVFWGCALRGENLGDINDNTALMAAINRRAANGRGNYARHVRDECMETLAELEPALQALIPPPEMQEKVRELEGAVGQGRSAWSGYIAYLEGIPEGEGYDEEDASEHVTAVARSWYDYRRLHNELNGMIAEKLDR